MKKTYVMTGSQPIVLSDGHVIAPGAGEFTASMDAGQEAFFVRVGAVRIAVAEYYATDALVYHVREECLVGNNIESANRREGRGGKRLCKECGKA